MRTSAFVRNIAGRLRRDELRAEAVIGVVFHEVRRRLPETGAAEIAAHLPRAVRSLWTQKDPQARTIEQPYQIELLGTVMQQAGMSDSAEAEHAVVAVLAALQALLDRVATRARAAQEILSHLPRDLEILWVAAERHRTAVPRRRRAAPRRAQRPAPPASRSSARARTP